MIDSAEVALLRQRIADDERTLQQLRAAECELQKDSNPHEFRAATASANVLSESRAAEERLRKDRVRLADLIRGSKERQECYRLQYRTICPALYLMINEMSFSPSGSGGVLAGGQLVWTKEKFTCRRRATSALAYSDELGLILLDPRWLKPVDDDA